MKKCSNCHGVQTQPRPHVLPWVTLWLCMEGMCGPLNDYMFFSDNSRSLNSVPSLKASHVLRVKYFSVLEGNARSATWALTVTVAGTSHLQGNSDEACNTHALQCLLKKTQ